MRKLMWFTFGFGTALGLTTYLLWDSDLLILGAVCLVLFAVSCFLPRFKVFRIISVVLLGSGMGFLWLMLMQLFYYEPLKEYDGVTVPITITAQDYSKESRYGFSVEGKVILGDRSYSALVYLDEGGINPGDQITGEFRLRLTTPGGMKESSYYQGKGILLVASEKGDISVASPEKNRIHFFPARFSRTIREILDKSFPEDVRPFAKALLLGDSEGLSYREDTAFKVSGIRHIIAVSGLHVMILYGLVEKITGKQRFLTMLLGIPVLALFAAMAGFTPSVTRASIMAGLMMLAGAVDREYDSASELSFACLCILAANPFAVTSASLQLSAASVAGILLIRRRIYSFLSVKLRIQKGKTIFNSLKRWTAGSISVTLSAQLLSVPLSTAYFGSVSLIGVVTNILTLWTVGIIFYGILLVCGIGLIAPILAKAAAWVIAWPMRYVLLTAGLLSRIPFAAVYTCSRWILYWLVLCYILLSAFLFLRRGRVRWYVSMAAAGLCAAVFLSCYIPRQDDCRVTVLDVGEGQSVLFQSRGESFLVDCGGSNDTAAADRIAEMLLSQGVFRLKGILLTHYDYDHAGALEYLLTRVKLDRLYLPEPDGEEFLAGKDISSSVIWVVDGMRIELGTGHFTVYDERSGKSSNENSLAVLFCTEECGILLTGDRGKSGEKSLVAHAELPKVDVLIAGHHGSKTSTNDVLLDAVSPDIVIISCGAGNSYGHPAEEVLKRLEEHGCIVCRTDLQGTIVYRGENHG